MFDSATMLSLALFLESIGGFCLFVDSVQTEQIEIIIRNRAVIIVYICTLGKT